VDFSRFAQTRGAVELLCAPRVESALLFLGLDANLDFPFPLVGLRAPAERVLAQVVVVEQPAGRGAQVRVGAIDREHGGVARTPINGQEVRDRVERQPRDA